MNLPKLDALEKNAGGTAGHPEYPLYISQRNYFALIATIRDLATAHEQIHFAEHKQLVAWAREHLAAGDGHIQRDLERGYRPTHREASAYRAAVLFVQRRMAEAALDRCKETWG